MDDNDNNNAANNNENIMFDESKKLFDDWFEKAPKKIQEMFSGAQALQEIDYILIGIEVVKSHD